jgi:hypothetical protein
VRTTGTMLGSEPTVSLPPSMLQSKTVIELS